jgi:hypothetical protein
MQAKTTVHGLKREKGHKLEIRGARNMSAVKN